VSFRVHDALLTPGRIGVHLNTVILHLDADAFFASVEQASNPQLKKMCGCQDIDS